MLDYAKIDAEYLKIHKRLDELEDRYSVTPSLRKYPAPIEIAAGLPLNIRCFLIYRTMQLPGLKLDCLHDVNAFTVFVTYYDPYELPIVARRIGIDFSELKTLWDASEEKVAPGLSLHLPMLVEKYLMKEGYLSDIATPAV